PSQISIGGHSRSPQNPPGQIAISQKVGFYTLRCFPLKNNPKNDYANQVNSNNDVINWMHEFYDQGLRIQDSAWAITTGVISEKSMARRKFCMISSPKRIDIV
ncbi:MULTISPECIES: hypothetical protein, partial [unclassified Moorena]|uniref:hypothetical protein n=1 Tax=unclassified Moorena TaxID=2683338 RepID=UPI0025CF0CFC